MCTVTIVPKGKNDFVLISNRDEAPDRISLAPDIYTIENTKMLFPKDELAGGSWIGVSEKNRVLCVLNGGFTFHERKAKYRLSRGVVMKDLLASEDIVLAINDYKLYNIEPFTMVIADWNNDLKFMELVWDGKQKYFKELPVAPKLWSSSTLYSDAMKKERLQWFEDFRKKHVLDVTSLLHFHRTAGKGNLDYGVIMDRHFVKTTSITMIQTKQDVVEMQFKDLKSGLASTKYIKTLQTIQ